VASEELDIKQGTVYRLLKFLECAGNIEVKSNNKFSIISIKNWHIYQQEEIGSEQQVNNKRTTSEQQVNTNKNRKELKKEKKIKTLYLEFVFLAEDEHKKLIDRFGITGTDERIERLNEYIGSKGVKYNSHYYTLLYWERRNSGNGGPPKPKAVNLDEIIKKEKEKQNERNNGV